MGPTTATIAIAGGRTHEVRTGEILRTLLLENKEDLYTMMGKMQSCGGGGQCASCLVDVTGGNEDALSSRTPTEQQRLKNKPPTFRMARQALVQGDVEVRLKP